MKAINNNQFTTSRYSKYSKNMKIDPRGGRHAYTYTYASLRETQKHKFTVLYRTWVSE